MPYRTKRNRLYDRYRRGAVLLPGDRRAILREETIGLMRTGFKIVAGQPVVTAGFTPLGLRLFQRAKFLSRADLWGRLWQWFYRLRNAAY